MQKEMVTLEIIFANGSKTSRAFYGAFAVPDAYRYANGNVSYSYGHGSVARVELVDCFTNSRRPLWDATWTPESNRAGLSCPA
jgi:hypothetical protein